MRRVSVVFILLVVCFVCTWPVIALLGGGRALPNATRDVVGNRIQFSEGPAIAAEVTAGPFDIHRRYRSMEGPWADCSFRIADLVASGHGVIAEPRVHFAEIEKQAPPMMASIVGHNTPEGLINTAGQPQSLFWLKEVKLEVVDESGSVLPNAEFICHGNIDVDVAQRNELLPDGQKCLNPRVFTLTQGQTDLRFPDGYALPVAGNEAWHLIMQAANRTTDAHRRIKQRATFYFIKDSDLVNPVTALSFCPVNVNVVVDRNIEDGASKCNPNCGLMSYAVNAPNNVAGGTFADAKGRVLSGHWVVPPGTHRYVSEVNEPLQQFSSHDKQLRYAWVHCHPCCTEVALVRCDDKTKTTIASATAETMFAGGLQLKRIEAVERPAEPATLESKGKYLLSGTYNNTTGKPLDSMLVLGMFFDDKIFKRPDWAQPGFRAAFCGLNGSTEKCLTRTPMFDPRKDGPLLTSKRKVILRTSEGNLSLWLDPTYAPRTATQFARLFAHGLFDGTRIDRYEPNFVLQISAAADKAATSSPLTHEAAAYLRRLPLETEAQRSGRIKHDRLKLSVARADGDPESGESSFSIILNGAPHLDGGYTIFGYVDDDDESSRTLQRIENNWKSEHPVIAGSSVL